jgi:putative phosphoribosyl transferase
VDLLLACELHIGRCKVPHSMTTPYQNRQEAGRLLARSLGEYAGRDDVLVLALSRGGVLVAVEVSEVLSAPVDLLATQEIRVPQHDAWQMEQAMGAVASGGVRILSSKVVDALHLPQQEIDQAVVLANEKLIDKERACRGLRPFPDLHGRTVILVDDGIEDVVPMQTAIEAMKACGSGRVIVAAPVGSASGCQQLAREADEVVCLRQVKRTAIRRSYRDLPLVTDEDARALLDRLVRRA